MLVLSRKKNESIWIGHNVRLCVVDIRGDKVRLGIEAPGEVPVHRAEVFRALAKQGVGIQDSGRKTLARPLNPECRTPNPAHGLLDLGGSIVIYQPEAAL